MNNGKICISICAETAEDLIAQIIRAEDLADVIEIRFDCLNESEIDKLWINLSNFRKKFTGKVLATFRPKTKGQGGNKDLSYEERKKFWNSCVSEFIDWADLEFDIKQTGSGTMSGILSERLIWSFHAFGAVPNDYNLNLILNKLSNLDRNKEYSVSKIAVQTKDISDSIPIWKLLKKAKSENKEIIPIAMGESGKWTRILGLAHGAFMTYAALDSGKKTAPGQVSVADLIEVYRVKELNEQTEIYGILGGNTSYSMSPFMQNAAFKFHGLNSVFVPLQMQNLDEFITRMVRENSREIELNFKGFSVTNPHKQNIIKHLDFIDETAKKIGAVNTVKVTDGKLHGYNTDAHGFITPLLNSYGDLSSAKVAVFGAGGAARACIYALKQSGAEVTIFARDLQKAQNLADDFKSQISNFRLETENYNDFEILVNSTPLGTKGELENESIVRAEQIEKVNLVYDLVYNPFQTKLMTEADRANVPKIGGMAMLIAQAMEQQKIWTGLDAPMKEMSAEVLKRLG